MAETTKKTTKNAEERVSVKLPRNGGQNANQDEFFSVNFKNYMIRRGERVVIPVELEEVILNGEKAEDAAIEYVNQKSFKEPKQEI